MGHQSIALRGPEEAGGEGGGKGTTCESHWQPLPTPSISSARRTIRGPTYATIGGAVLVFPVRGSRRGPRLAPEPRGRFLRGRPPRLPGRAPPPQPRHQVSIAAVLPPQAAVAPRLRAVVIGPGSRARLVAAGLETRGAGERPGALVARRDHRRAAAAVRRLPRSAETRGDGSSPRRRRRRQGSDFLGPSSRKVRGTFRTESARLDYYGET